MAARTTRKQTSKTRAKRTTAARPATKRPATKRPVTKRTVAKRPVTKRTVASGPRLKASPPLAGRTAPRWDELATPILGYYRHPTLQGERVVFCCDDDLWSVTIAGRAGSEAGAGVKRAAEGGAEGGAESRAESGAEGGIARRLTTSTSTVAWPRFSPDGNWLAFAGSDEGGIELFVMPAEGGEARRLTHLGSMMTVLGWSADGRCVFIASDAGQAYAGYQHLYAVPVAGGEPQPLNLGPARAYATEPSGPGRALARNALDPARWKRYRGGTAGTLWVDPTGKGSFRRILKQVRGNLASPMWIGKRIYFIGDHEGVGNLYSCLPSGRGLTRHTDHGEFYARFPSTDGRRIVYHAGADLYLFDPESDETTKLDVQVRSPRVQRRRKFISAGAGFESCDPHPAGHSLLLTVRGRPVSLGFWEGPATEFGQPWLGRHRLASWLADGRRFVAVTDEDGEESLEIVDPETGTRKIKLGLDLGRILSLTVAPIPAEEEKPAPKGRAAKKKARRPAKAKQADRIAITNHRQELFIVDLTAASATRIERSSYDRIRGVSWSPDGRWLAYGCAIGRHHVVIKIAEAKHGRTHQVTEGDFMDFSPCFDPEGKYLYFLSLRTYDPVYDVIQFGLGFPRGVRPYLVTLKADQTSPFLPAPRPLAGKNPTPDCGNNPWEITACSEDEPGSAQKQGAGARPRVEIDFDGITGRVLAIPMPEGRYDDLQAAAGRVFVRSQPIEGSLGMSWGDMEPPSKAAIEVYDFGELKAGTLVTGISSFALAADQKTLVYRAGRKLRAVAAASEPGKLPPGEEIGRKSGWVDLARVSCEVRPGDEWRQMLTEAWRLQRDQFWVPDLSKIDWQQILERYLPLVDRVATRGELSDLIWEMQGELGTSHCYEFGGDYRAASAYPMGRLGADLAYDAKAGAWKVTRIPQGDCWEPKAASPLASPGLGVREGSLIHAINGRAVGPDRSPNDALVSLAGKEVWLTVSDPAGRAGRRAKSDAPRTISLRTLRTEYPLRYRDWVERNRAWVHEKSKGQAGYVHIPNMGPLGYSEFHRYFLAELDRSGLVIDVRFNGGGHVSQLLFDKLLRKRVGYDISRYMAPEPYPGESPAGPMVALTNELAGSDGDIFSHCWKLYRLGPLVGTRTWGGVVGIWPRHPLVDGSLTTQPEFSFWFEDVGWGVENYGTDPDIEVDIRPQEFAAGQDPQLERGLRELLGRIRAHKPPKPDVATRASLALPKLPKR